MKLKELKPDVAVAIIAWMIGSWKGDSVTFPCRRGHQYCTVAKDYYCLDEAFETLAELRRQMHGISAPATPSGSIKAT